MSKSMITLSAKNARDGSECEIEAPVYVNIRLIRNSRYGLRAIVKLEFMGITINDIQIRERRGALSIVYPYRTFEKNDERRQSSIVFPNNVDLGSKFNHIIQNEYSQRVLSVGNDPIVGILLNQDEDQEESAEEAA